mmetsp:Transcript_30729/g.27178  ORF Transcript_30729/g.27178 Transcript_30729/m.27178 type:complete len:384 (-) Transcript_30729:30-1181(-)
MLRALIDNTYELLMTECSLTIGEARPLVKYQEQFLGGNNAFISLIHNQIVEYFGVFAEMIKVNLEKSSFVVSDPDAKNKSLENSLDNDQDEEKKIKGLVGQSMKEVEIIPLNSYNLLSIISICNKIKKMGMTKVISIVNDLVHAEETKDSDSLLGSVELWSNFELEKVPLIEDNLNALLKHCNKFYVLYVSRFVDDKLRRYLKRFHLYYEDEPVLISGDIVSIFKKFKEEWRNLDILDPNSQLSISPYANIPSPELLEKAKKHGSIMLEMDMFSARKKKVFIGLLLNRYSIFIAIFTSMFKSLYERIRKIRLSTKAFEQMHADISFIFKTTLQFSKMEDVSTLNGLVNQVMFSAINRCEDHKHLDILIVNNMVSTAQEKVDKA